MKVVIPAAGVGKRLYPHTHTKPKPMVFVAGKPIIGHILDRLIDLQAEEVVIVVGYMKDKTISYIDANYSSCFGKISYVMQEEPLGLGHSIYVTKDVVGNSPVMIALGDMIFKAGYKEFLERHEKNGECSGSIGVKTVDMPQYYGIVYLDDEGTITKLEEKPERTTSNLGIAGIYIIDDTSLLFESLDKLISGGAKKEGEYQLTDALQIMVDAGATFKTFHVHDWYDCGRADTLLEVNRLLLAEAPGEKIRSTTSIIIQPVAVGDDVEIINSIIGPDVSIADHTIVKNSIIADSIIGSGAKIVNMNLQTSILGDDVNLAGKPNALNIGDSSTIEF
ncbi:MAG: NTP transferase domain-containing protein [Euryarchaeota archaeon]|nr:NTP transferase domain-containing protein [Euryarchaeota archaeon]